DASERCRIVIISASPQVTAKRPTRDLGSCGSAPAGSIQWSVKAEEVVSRSFLEIFCFTVLVTPPVIWTSQDPSCSAAAGRLEKASRNAITRIFMFGLLVNW